MTIKFSEYFLLDLQNYVSYITKDKPVAAKKFKIDILKNIKKDLKFPYNFKKSIYFDNQFIRDYVSKGYTTIYEIDEKNNSVTAIGLIKYKEKL